MCEMPKLSDADIVRYAEELSGHFTRPEDLTQAIAELAALGLDPAFDQGDRITVMAPGGSYEFATGCDEMAMVIGYMLRHRHVLAAALLLMRAAGYRDEIGPVEFERAMQRVRFNSGHAPSGVLGAVQPQSSSTRRPPPPPAPPPSEIP